MRNTKQDRIKIHMQSIKSAHSTAGLQITWAQACHYGDLDIYLLNALIHAHGRLNNLNGVAYFYQFAKSSFQHETTVNTYTGALSGIIPHIKSEENNLPQLLDILKTIYTDAIQAKKYDRLFFLEAIKYAKTVMQEYALSQELHSEIQSFLFKVNTDLDAFIQTGFIVTAAPDANSTQQKSAGPKIRFFYNPYHRTQPKVYYIEKSGEENKNPTMKNS